MVHPSAPTSIAGGATIAAPTNSMPNVAAMTLSSPVPALPDLASAIAAFCADLRIAGRAERTVGGHASELRRYAAWLQRQHLHWLCVTPRQLKQYARTRAHLGASSRASLICTLRVFYTWAITEEYVTVSPAASLRTPRRPKATPRALSVAQVRLLLFTLDAQARGSLREQRDRALLVTALYTGMRASELARLIWSDVDLDAGRVIVRLGKGQKGRAVRLHPDLISVLCVWQDAQRGRGNECVFSTDRQPIVGNRVGKVARYYAKRLNLPLTAHTLRHTFATWSLRKSGNIYSVSKALGHSQVRQTEVYLRADDGDSEAAVTALPAPGDW